LCWLVRVAFRFVGGNLAKWIVRAATACVRSKVAKDRPTNFTPRRQAKPRVRIVECRLNSSAIEEIASEMLAARLAHLVGFEERAAYAVLCMLAEPVPSIGIGLNRSVEKIFEKFFD
jgi:hypothetical protein